MFLGKVALQLEATLLKSHFGMDVPLQICCIFSEHFFVGTPLVDCFWAQKFFSHPENTCSKLTIETLEKGVKYIVNFEHISHLVLMFILLTLAGKCRLGLYRSSRLEVFFKKIFLKVSQNYRGTPVSEFFNKIADLLWLLFSYWIMWEAWSRK